jgi:histidinol phosphatase-like PHP family hydrolase
MDLIVDRIVKVLREEPIDIYVNPNFLPVEMREKYDELWTDARISRVIEALVTRGIALEINARYRIPSEKIIRAAKNAGIRFAMGTNNTNEDIGQLEYCVEMIKKCELTHHNMFYPGYRGN